MPRIDCGLGPHAQLVSGIRWRSILGPQGLVIGVHLELLDAVMAAASLPYAGSLQHARMRAKHPRSANWNADGARRGFPWRRRQPRTWTRWTDRSSLRCSTATALRRYPTWFMELHEYT